MRSPSWQPDSDIIAAANVMAVADELGLADYEALHAWSVENRASFWELVINRLGIRFARPATAILEGTPQHPLWFPGARLNIAESLFQAPEGQAAILYRIDGELRRLTYGELRRQANRFAYGFVAAGMEPGDRVAIAMVMNVESVIAYIGTVLAGGVVVSIADSFAADEIATRLRIAGADTIVTQDVIVRAGKQLPMYDKVVSAGIERAIVVPVTGEQLRGADVSWDDFLSGDDSFDPVVQDAAAPTNVLFSSGTTGDPKAIVWSQLTPLKAAMDGHFHQDIHPGDLVAWPTNLGWMMGPWLIYASMLNRATFALYDDVPNTSEFVRFVAEAGVSILGVVPSLVAAWRDGGALAGIDLGAVRLVSSTGETSNADDMSWLMAEIGAPVIEYCGGTEIGGGYLSGTVATPAVAGTFTTPCLGLDFRIVDETQESGGELFLVPPSIGLSESLLNRDHDDVYYSDLPESDVPLRRHGDQIQRLDGGYYRAMGRVDDTMNLGGIKVSSAEIERVINEVDGVAETAAIAVSPPGGGPSELVIYVVATAGGTRSVDALRGEMQQAIRSQLNPLFKIGRVLEISELPRTASAKVMRKDLRAMAGTR